MTSITTVVNLSKVLSSNAVKEAQDKLRADLKLEYYGCNRVGAARNSNAAKVHKPGPAGGRSKDPLANKLVFEDTEPQQSDSSNTTPLVYCIACDKKQVWCDPVQIKSHARECTVWFKLKKW